MITDEEKKELLEMATPIITESVLLKLPEVVGNMMSQYQVLIERNKKLYTDYPEFKGHTDAVKSVIEMVEGENANLNWEDILKKAVPKIRKRISTIKNLDIKNIDVSPDRGFKQIEAPEDDGLFPDGEI